MENNNIKNNDTNIIKGKSENAIKNTDVKSSVGEKKEFVNSQNIEESQKKSVSSEKSSEKVINNTSKDNNSSNYSKFADFSSRIKYDDVLQHSQHSKYDSSYNDNIIEDDIIKSNDNQDVIKPDNIDNSAAIKTSHSAENIKQADNSETFHHTSVEINSSDYKIDDTITHSTSVLRQQGVSNKGIINSDDNINGIIKPMESDVVKNNLNKVDNGIVKNVSENSIHQAIKPVDNSTVKNTASKSEKPNKLQKTVKRNIRQKQMADVQKKSTQTAKTGNNQEPLSNRSSYNDNIQHYQADAYVHNGDFVKSEQNLNSSYAERTTHEQSNSVYKYVEEKTDVITHKADNIISDIKNNNINTEQNIIKSDFKSDLSATGKDYIDNKRQEKEKSAISKITKDKLAKKMSDSAREKAEKIYNSTDNLVEHTETVISTEDIDYSLSSTGSLEKHKALVNNPQLYDDNSPYRYVDSTFESYILNENNNTIMDSSVINKSGEKNFVTSKKSHNKKAKSNLINKKSKFKNSIKSAKDGANTVINEVSSVNKIINSEDKTEQSVDTIKAGYIATKSTIKGVRVAATTPRVVVKSVRTLKTSTQRNIDRVKNLPVKVNSAVSLVKSGKAAEVVKDKTKNSIKNLGIYAVNHKRQIVESLLVSPGKAVVKASGSALKNGVIHYIDDIAEDNSAAKALSLGIKSVKATKTVTKDVIKTGKFTYKTAKITAKATKNGIKQLRKNIRRARNAALRAQKIAAKSAKYIAKVTVEVVKATVHTVATICAALSPFLVVILLICAVVVIIASVLWQTETELDTTQLVKYISELDYQQQNNWWRGKTAVDLDKLDHKSSLHYRYYYLIAEDVEPDKLLPDGSMPPDSDMNVVIRVGNTASGNPITPTWRGFNKTFSSADELLEAYRWTTDDYRSALAYLQVKNNNLGWLGTHFGFVGEMVLKNSARELHDMTTKGQIIEKRQEGSEITYSFQNPIYTTSYGQNHKSYHYMCGRRYSVQYLIDNDMIIFDDDPAINAQQKEMYKYTKLYGNFAIGNLQFPVELAHGEKIKDRICKNFGKQVIMKYNPPSYSDSDTWGNVTHSTGYHYANDILASSGENFYAPIGGLCKVNSREGRGYEFVISTSYNGSNFNFDNEGYCIKISCAGTSALPINTPVIVRAGDILGTVGDNMTVNYKKPVSSDDSPDNEDLFADKLFPCCTGTNYKNIGSNQYSEPDPEYEHLHIEMYKLPCNFFDVSSIENNVLAPELFFDYSNEED